MNHQIIDIPVSLDDPEAGFTVTYQANQVVVSLVDWLARRITLRFPSPYRFSFQYANGFPGLPEACFLQILDSTDIRDLREGNIASQDEELHHFVISTNEDGWCEVIAPSFTLEIIPPQDQQE